jgi:chemotaxis protein MotA
MELVFILGIILGIPFIIVASITAANGEIIIFVDPASVFCTVGGGLVAAMISTHPRNYKNVITLIKKGWSPPKQNPRDIIPTLVSFAEKARREGLLALEDNIEELEDEFLKKGIQLVVDGTDPELVKAIMNTELNALVSRHENGVSIFKTLGSQWPAWGMIGTLMGLVIMLKNLEDPKSIGQGMATALITTFYGAVLANGVALPIAARLEEYSKVEYATREIMVEGMLSIQSGDNPRIVEEKLLAFLSPTERRLARAEKAA